MKKTGLILIIALLTVFGSTIMPLKANALWYFTWNGTGGQDITYYSTDPQTGAPSSQWTGSSVSVNRPWMGYFTIPDSAFVHKWDDGGVIDLRQYKEFTFLAYALDGTLMRGTGFNADESINFLGLYLRSDGVMTSSSGGDAIDFILEDPAGIHPSMHVRLDEQVGPNSYTDYLRLPNSSEWMEVSVGHSGSFSGQYVPDAPPVPEPATFLLVGGGLFGFAFWRRRKQH